MMHSLLTLIDEYEVDIWHSDIGLKRNEYLLRKGETEKYIYYILDGAVIIQLETDKDAHCIRFGYKGSFITALDSYISGQASMYSIQAIRKTNIKRIRISDYDRFLNSNEERRAYKELLFNTLIIQQMEREVDLLTASPYKRYERVLKRSPELFQEIPSRYIASYLRMTPETLSRIGKNIDLDQD